MIKINISKPIKSSGKLSLFLSFPFDQEIINIVRSFSGRYYHVENKIWEINYNFLNKLISELNKNNFEYVILNENLLKESNKIKVPEGFEYKTEPYDHQKEAFEYGLKNDSFLLGDEQGLGKTKVVIDLAVAKKLEHNFKHCLIICGVNGIKWNWKNEVEIHSDEQSCILGTRKRKNGNINDGGTKAKLEDLSNLPDSYFLITNIESLRNKEIAKKIKELTKNETIGLVAVDEIHRCKNPQSQQGKGLLSVDSKFKIAMTGTPLLNSPLDIYIILRWLGYEKHSFYSFKYFYCFMGGFQNKQIMGYKNLDQLKANLDDVMIRRLKKDVLDLPPKIYVNEYVEMNRKQTSIYNEVLLSLRKDIDKIKLSRQPLSKLIRLRQATAATEIISSKIKESAKFERLEELIEDEVLNGGKVLVYSNWTSVTDILFDKLEKYNPAIITGQVKDRQFEQNMFMEEDSCKCLIATISAVGVGLTLTKATMIIFLDEPWNMATKEQAEDRAHRIGTTLPLTVVTIMAKDTIDEKINNIVKRKGKMADLLVDGLDSEAMPILIDYLLA